MAEWIVPKVMLKNQRASHTESETGKNAEGKTGGKPKPEAPVRERNQGRKVSANWWWKPGGGCGSDWDMVEILEQGTAKEPCPSPLASHSHCQSKNNKSYFLEQKDRAEAQGLGNPEKSRGTPNS